jgi:hypothetical protein
MKDRYTGNHPGSSSDGAGYDVASFELDGGERFIKVMTTGDGPDTDFFVSTNEVAFSKRHAESYCLYRLHGFDPETNRGTYYVLRGSLEQSALHLEPVQFRARMAALAAALPDS